MESKIWLHSIIKDDTPIEDAEEEESRNVLTEKCVLRYFSSFAFVCLLLECCCLRFTASTVRMETVTAKRRFAAVLYKYGVELPAW